MSHVADDRLPLQRAYHWESKSPGVIFLSQPMGGGVVKDYTWAQAMDEARRMATHLKAQGFEPGTHIALMSKNSAHWIIADLAIWMAGHVSVPLYPTLAAETVRQILEHSESKLLFIGKLDDWEMMKDGVPTGLPAITLPLSPKTSFPTWADIVAKTAPMTGNPVRAADELATIIYTSGTTGLPKGVMHSFDSMAWSIDAILQRVSLGPSDRLMSYLPLSHVAERLVVEMGALATGARVYFTESLETFAADLSYARPTLFFSVPRLWVRFQQGVHKQMPPEKLSRLLMIPIVGRIVAKKILTGLGLDQCRYASGGAAPMPPELLRWYKKLGLEVLEGYGMTENFALSHGNTPGSSRPGYVGVAYPGVETRIDPASGEVQMRSPGLMMGYYKAPDLTLAAMTEDGWLRTGDKGEVDAEGRLRITGRVKDLFKTSKGKYVAPGPIEDKLVIHPAVEACCVAGANFGQPFGLIMLAPDAAAGAGKDPAVRAQLTASLKAHLDKINATLDPHEQMDFIAVVGEPWSVENGFLTPTFKIKRNRIEDVYGRQFEAWAREKKPVVWQAA